MSRTLRLSILCHGATTSSRLVGFGGDAPLSEGEADKAAKLAAFIGRSTSVLAAPELSTRQTADALGFEYSVDPSFRNIDYGRWSGRLLADIGEQEPDGLAQWISDVDIAPHGGDSISALVERMSDWIADNFTLTGHYVIITHAVVIRAMIVAILQAPPQAFWKIDIEHLSLTDIRSDGRRWALRSTGRILHS